MKRKDLKKTINIMCGALVAECVALRCCNEIIHVEDIDNLLNTIGQLQEEMVKRISHVEPGNTKAFFKNLRMTMLSRTNEIVDQIIALA